MGAEYALTGTCGLIRHHGSVCSSWYGTAVGTPGTAMHGGATGNGAEALHAMASLQQKPMDEFSSVCNLEARIRSCTAAGT